MAAPSVSTRLPSAELEAVASAVAAEAAASVAGVEAMAAAMAATVEAKVVISRVDRAATPVAARATVVVVSKRSTLDLGCILTYQKATPAAVATTSSSRAVAAGKFISSGPQLSQLRTVSFSTSQMST